MNDLPSVKEQFITLIHQLQQDICQALEQADGKAVFHEDLWERPEGGGGKTRVISGGNVFEKGGVNTSVVHGVVTDPMRRQLGIAGHTWFATGISSVIHPFHPMVPTVHFNYRMFELYHPDGSLADRWFGGGTDLTPYYLDVADVQHFHGVFKAACDGISPVLYPVYKQQCDDYFVNHHRGGERRGVGGIFYDHERERDGLDAAAWIRLAERCGYAFMDAYLPLVEKNKQLPFGPAQKYWQEIRRGRYTEFNLVHDRGTLFGLKTNGRTESILMSLPPTVRFDYNYQPAPGSPEAALQDVCLQPVDWLNIKK